MGTISRVARAKKPKMFASLSGFLLFTTPTFLRPPENRDNDHLEAAWIYAVLQLKLSAAIEHVSRLELTLQGDKIGVNFSGRRYKKYSNQSAFQIEFSGICPLG